jgi:SET domain-containing protein
MSYRAKYYIKSSSIDGNGVFAARDIKKNEIVFILRGEKMFLIEKTKKDAMYKPNRIGIGGNNWIDPVLAGRYINHSCDPNVGRRGIFWFVAMKKIKKNEEIVFDYAMSEDGPWEMRCNCKSKKCRKIIRGVQYLPKEIFMKYFSYLPCYLQNAYFNFSKKIKKYE